MDLLEKLVRDMVGIKEGVEVRDFVIRRSSSPNVIEPVCIDISLVIGREIPKSEYESIVGFRQELKQQFVAGERLKAGDIIVVKPKKKMGRPETRVKPKPPAPEKKDRLDVTRTFATTEDDIKLVRTFMYSWRKDAGALTEDQQRALKPTDGRHVGGLSMIERQQILDIFNDVRKKKGLIK